jgi:hypothetical protein
MRRDDPALHDRESKILVDDDREESRTLLRYLSGGDRCERSRSCWWTTTPC